jgi:hypothetical protein
MSLESAIQHGGADDMTKQKEDCFAWVTWLLGWHGVYQKNDT